MGMTSLTAGTPETAGHTRSTAVLEQAGLLQHIRHVPQYRGTWQGAPGGQGDMTASFTSQAQGTHETRGQHMESPKYKSNSKAGIPPLPRTLQMKLVAVFLPST